MYENRFGLHRQPFQTVLNDNDYFESESFRELSPLLLHALRSDLGVAVLTGPAGVGKSVTLEKIRRCLEPDSLTVLVRGGSARTPAELLQTLYRRLLKNQTEPDTTRQTPSAVCRWDVLDRLQRVADFWGPLVILLDDAHLAEPAVFAELRALMEEEFNGRKLVRILTAGPLSLEEVLAEPAMGDFSRKIRTHVFLQPLRSAEAVTYLQQQIFNAGGSFGTIFDSEAVEKIIAAADGIPQCLNLLADESLLICEDSGLSRVSGGVVNQALGRLQHLPIAWNAAPDAASDSAADVAPRTGVVEIGGAPETAVRDVPEDPEQPSGSIEFGAPAPEAVVDSESSAPGVIDFGAPVAFPDEALSAEQINTDTPVEDVPHQPSATTAAEAIVPDEMESFGCELPEDAIEISATEFLKLADAADSVDFGSFTPWNPAGRWPTDSPLATTAESVQKDQEYAPFFSVQQANCTPVFDRYTWCELGRAVSADQGRRHHTFSLVEHDVIWPPDVTGVAPRQSVPVTPLDEDFAELLSNLSTLTAAPQSSPPDENDADVLCDISSYEDTGNPCDTLPTLPDADPESTIDQLQDLLDAEIFEDVAEKESVPFHASAARDEERESRSAHHGTSDQAATVTTEDEVARRATDVVAIEDHDFEVLTTDLIGQMPEPCRPREADRRVVSITCARATSVISAEIETVEPEACHASADVSPTNLPCESEEVIPRAKGEVRSIESAGEPRNRFRDLFTRLRKMQNRSA